MRTRALVGVCCLAAALFACKRTRNDVQTDLAITGDVRAELRKENVPWVIEVVTSDGVVTLSGAVPDAQAKARVEDIAENVDGVDRVVNNLRPTMAGDAPARGIPPPVPDLR